MKTALSIAGSDPSGGAGILADLKTFQSIGVFGMGVITAVTVQNTQKVFAVQGVRPEIVFDQIFCLFEDSEINAIKIGMVFSADIVKSISSAINRLPVKPPVILDPVMISKSGYPLLADDAMDALVSILMPQADIITPNIPEAEAVSGISINNIEDMKSAAYTIAEKTGAKVIVKGGHLDSEYAYDLVYDGMGFRVMEAPKIGSRSIHGTGCAFSSALAAYIASGEDFRTACDMAKAFITSAIEHGIDTGRGAGVPNHFYHLYRKAEIS
jgi:hydroxymethylpyrimidine/phosphomethylpyrimidine kinase